MRQVISKRSAIGSNASHSRSKSSGEPSDVRELDPHVEHAARQAVELVALHDRAPLLHEQSGHRVHDARRILAGQHQDAVLSVGGPRHDTSTNMVIGGLLTPDGCGRT